jgi:hypothetical protein
MSSLHQNIVLFEETGDNYFPIAAVQRNGGATATNTV